MNYPYSIAVDTSGRFAYVTNLVPVNSNFYMSSFAIDSTLGALTFVNFTPPLGAGTADIVYVGNQVGFFAAVNAQTGAAVSKRPAPKMAMQSLVLI